MRGRLFFLVCAFVLGTTTLANAGQTVPQRWAVCGEWRQVVTPVTYGFPRDLAVVSPEEAWLSGYVGEVAGLPVVLHWTGMRWEKEAFPTHVAAEDEELAGFAVVSPDDVWAVGSWRASMHSHPLVAHWDGASPRDAWAVGYRGGMYDRPRPLIMRWQGSGWQWAQVPDVHGRFYAVDGTPHNLWALSWRYRLGADGPPPLDTFHRC